MPILAIRHVGSDRLLMALLLSSPSGLGLDCEGASLSAARNCSNFSSSAARGITKNYGKHQGKSSEHKHLASCSPGSLNELILQLGPHTDGDTYASLLRRCTIEKAPSQGERVHELMISCGFADNTFLSNLLLQMYNKCGSLQHARSVFGRMACRNLYSWTIMLAACAQNGQGKEALKLFAQMQAEGFDPDKVTSICVLGACANAEALEEGQGIHDVVVGNGWESDIVVGTALVDMYGKCKSLDDAWAVFAEMPEQNLVSWSAMIAACAQNEHGKKALQLFKQMQAEGFEPDRITLICILDACASAVALQEGQEIHARVVSNGWESDDVVGNALITMYGKCRSLDDAMVVFAEMPQQNLVSWNAMIAECAQNGHGRVGLQLFCQMQAKGFEPDNITFIGVLEACGGIVALEEGREVHAKVVGNGWESDVVVATALLNMYGKCGNLDDAGAVFAEMPWRSVVSWSAMISVCAQNGHSKEALELFYQMQAEGFKPEKITFLCVLTACSHMGLLEDAKRYFDSMSQDYDISPSEEHYVCMIDLLGRAGQLDKAEEVINSMPCEVSPSAWLSLLSSCRIHGDVERGVRVANYILDLDENNASPYVLLGNIHAAAGNWENVANAREASVDEYLKKVPDVDCIYVENDVHDLAVGDVACPRGEQIYDQLQKLSSQMGQGCVCA